MICDEPEISEIRGNPRLNLFTSEDFFAGDECSHDFELGRNQNKVGIAADFELPFAGQADDVANGPQEGHLLIGIDCVLDAI